MLVYRRAQRLAAAAAQAITPARQSMSRAAAAIEEADAATASASALEMSGVGKTFDRLAAVQDVSFRVRQNEFVSIVGPSGCGKSTLLRMAAGLTAPSTGSISLRGRELRAPAGDVGMVFQAPVLLPWRSTLDNVLFVAEMRGEPRSAWLARARSLLVLSGLGGFEQRLPHELSGGMQQRVAICRALLLNPSLILMDEPFGALDVITRERMGFELQRIWSVSRNTVLLVTHSIAEAALLSDRILVMCARPGRIIADVPVDLPRPRDRRMLAAAPFVEIAGRVNELVAAGWRGDENG
jgi:NitT/TauT family transport system ATP-binding protein